VSSNPTGKEVLRASLGLFRQDRHLIVLPLLAAITALVTMAAVGLPIVAVLGTGRVGIAVAVLAAGVVSTSATLFFNVALVFAATERIEGRTPTVGGSLAMAWGRRATILRWALLAAVAGTLVRTLERRFGVFGRLLGFAGAFAWTVATFLVLPVLAFEDLGPRQALRRSSSLLKERFGTVTRSGLRFGVLFGSWLVAAMAVVLVGAMLVPASHVLGGGLVVVGLFGVLAVAMYASAASIYLRTILYRFSVGLSVPELGVDLTAMLSKSREPAWS
jgi:hypothetical protein